MCVISSTEFKNNFGKYVELAQKEEIQVTKRGIVIFRMVPERKELVKKMESFFDLLPSDASIGKDPDERD